MACRACVRWRLVRISGPRMAPREPSQGKGGRLVLSPTHAGAHAFLLGNSGHEPLHRCMVLVECVAICRDCKTLQVGVGLRGAGDVIEHGSASSGGAAPPLSFRPVSPSSRPAAGARPVLGAHDARQKPWSRVSAAAGGGNGVKGESMPPLVAFGGAVCLGGSGCLGGRISA